MNLTKKSFGLRIKASLIFVAVLILMSCASGRHIAAIPPIDQLRSDIQDIFEDPAFYVANWGIYIESLKTGEIIYKQNPYKLFMPASNMKLFTTSTALIRLGPDFKYTTALLKRGEVDSGGVLHGDLLIRGSGDPSFGGRSFHEISTAIFENWADSLKKRGIKRIEGNIIGDDNYFDDSNYGSGWEVDDLTYWYAAPAGGLSFNENVVYITVKPAANSGEPPVVTAEPPTKYIQIINNAVTVEPTRIQRLTFNRALGGNTITVNGTISVDRNPVEQRVSIENPTLFTSTVLKEILESNGITVSGKAEDIDHFEVTEDYEDEDDILASCQSPSLDELIKVVNKGSHNFYADQLLKTLGKEFTGEGSFSKGAEVLKGFLGSIGVDPAQFSAYDGSGLSRHNLVMPNQIAVLLKYMRSHPYFQYLYDSLPIAGVDGTISSRMKNTAAENIVHAKTGTIRYVRALSGYVTSIDNEEFVVAILVNHYTTPSSTAGALQDRLFVLLANFSRGRK